MLQCDHTITHRITVTTALFVCVCISAIAEAIPHPPGPLSNNTVYSTDPRIRFSPETCRQGSAVSAAFGAGYSPWDLEIYEAVDGLQHSYYHTSSLGNVLDTDQARKFSFRFRGTHVQVFGAPPQQLARLSLLPGNVEMCLQGTCYHVDTVPLYNVTDSTLPVLLWSSDSLAPDPDHMLEMRLLDTTSNEGQLRGMTIHHLVYHDREKNVPQSYRLRSTERLVHATYYSTHPSIIYSPHDTCHRGPLGRCKHYSPWTREEHLLTQSNNPTFHHTSSWENGEYDQDLRSISFSFQGIALYIYGASQSQLAEIGEGDYQHGHQEVCVDNECHAIDTHQIYLNVHDRHASEPVLLWSSEGYPSKRLRHVKLRLLDHRCPSGLIRRMTFNRFVVAEVREKSGWTHPIPHTKYTLFSIPSLWPSFRYHPDPDCMYGNCKKAYDPWDQQQYALGDSWMHAYMRTSTWDHDPRARLRYWNFNFTGAFSPCHSDVYRYRPQVSLLGHNVRVYGAPKRFLVHPLHAKQDICLDGRCIPVDVEHAYLALEPHLEYDPVLLWSADDLDITFSHHLSMRMTESWTESEGQIKGMTISHVDYTKVDLPTVDRPVKPPTPAPDSLEFDFAHWAYLAPAALAAAIFLIWLLSQCSNASFAVNQKSASSTTLHVGCGSCQQAHSCHAQSERQAGNNHRSGAFAERWNTPPPRYTPLPSSR